MLTPGQQIWFHNQTGLHKAYVERVNKKTVNVLEEVDYNKEGIQLWRITEPFISTTPEGATTFWLDYMDRLKEYRRILKERREAYNYRPRDIVIVEPFNKPFYTAEVLKVDRICLIVSVQHDNKLMRVDKAICSPAAGMHLV